MKNERNYISAVCLLSLSLAAAGLAGCGSAAGTSGTATEVSGGTSGAVADKTASEEVRAVITGTGDNASVEGTGVTVEKKTVSGETQEGTSEDSSSDETETSGQGVASECVVVTVTEAGTYRLTGELTEGQIRVETGKEDEVRLILDDFTIHNSTSAAIYGVKSGSITLVLAENTENQVSDGASYVFEDGEDEPDAAIFSKDDLILEGEGSLTVEGNYQDAIRGKDDLQIHSGTYVLHAVSDGLKGKDSVEIAGGTFTIQSGSDGIQSSNEEEEGKGYIRITDGQFTIEAGKKGILAASLVEVSGGTIQITAEDDTIHTDGDVAISGGSFVLNSGDDAIHGNNQVKVTGGNIEILSCVEGIEGLSVDIEGGDITLTASDDGINAADGSSDQETETGAEGRREIAGEASAAGRAENGGFGKMGGGRGGQNPFEVTEGAYIRIAGGTIRIQADGDAIDSNGDLMIEGGTIYVEGPLHDGDGILDYNGTGTITGGTFVGTGSAGMLQSFSNTSEQPVLVMYFEETQAAGTELSVKTENGTELFSETPSRQYAVLIFSSPELETGATYQVSAGSTVQEVTLDGIVTEAGTRPQMGFGGFGGRGGGFRGGQMPEGMEEGAADAFSPGESGAGMDGQQPPDGTGMGGQQPPDGAGMGGQQPPNGAGMDGQ